MIDFVVDTFRSIRNALRFLTSFLYFPFALHFHNKVLSFDECFSLLNSKKNKTGIIEVPLNNHANVKARFDLSIIVPVYNAEAFLNELLVCLTTQKTHYKYEIILVDNASTDKSSEVIETFFSKATFANYTLVRLDKNRGAGSSRNEGIKYASGEYIMEVDSDDLISPFAIETLLNASKNFFFDIVQAYPYTKSFKSLSKSATVKNAIHQRMTGAPWSKIFRTSLFTKAGFLLLNTFEDTPVEMLINPLANNFRTVSNKIYYHRRHHNNSLKNAIHSNKCIDIVWATQACIDFAKANPQCLNDKMYCSVINHFTQILYNTTRGLDKNEIFPIFLVACHYFSDFDSLYKNRNSLSFTMKYRRLALLRKNLSLWKCFSRYEIHER